MRSTRSPGEVARGQDTQAAQGGRLRGISGEDIGRLVTLYRDVCADLARSKSRRAFSEHVEAVGALYARARAAPCALAALVRFVKERIHGDVPAELTHRSGVPLETCERVWMAACRPDKGAELEALRALHRVLQRTRLS